MQRSFHAARRWNAAGRAPRKAQIAPRRHPPAGLASGGSGRAGRRRRRCPMFVQVIEARTSDPAAVKAAMARWVAKLAPGATGWLGSTAGMTPDGRMVAIVRFDSEEHARVNSDRP